MNFYQFRERALHYYSDSSDISTISDMPSENENNTGEPSTQNRRHSAASSASYFQIRESLILILVFDGKNIPVNQFTADCKGAYSLIDPDDREFFFRAILQVKLTGEAAILRSIYTFEDLDTLCATLEKEFSKGQSIEQWESEANKLRQSKNEPIEKYIDKTKKLYKDLTFAIASHPNQSEKAFLKTYTTNKLITYFVGGLDKKIREHLLLQKFQSLDDAIETTTKYVAQLQYHSEREQIFHTYTPYRPTCDYCKKLGHIEAVCRKKIFDSQNRAGRTQSYRNFGFNNYTPRESTSYHTNNYYRNNREQMPRNYQTLNPNYNNFNNNRQFNQNSYQRDSSSNANQNSSLNFRGQARSAQRPGQQFSRANPITATEAGCEHLPSAQHREISSVSPSMNLETPTTDSS